MPGGGSGTVIEWQQDAGMLYAGGNSKNIYVWDVQREMCCGGFSAKVLSVICLRIRIKTDSFMTF